MPNYYDHFGAANPFTASGINLELDKLDAQIYANAGDIAILEGDVAAISVDPSVYAPQARLSLSSSLPVSTADVTAATAVYLHPYNGQTVAIYDGSEWVGRTLSAAVNIAIPASTATVYDVFAYWTGAAIALEVVAWSTATARATALATQNGIYVKSGDATRRYMGTFRTTTVSGQSEDSVTKRYLWNMYNRRSRALQLEDATASWVYSVASWRQVRATSTNKVELVIGLSEDPVELTAMESAVSTGLAYTGIGVDTTTASSAGVNNASVTHYSMATARYRGFPGIGYHALNWIEFGGTSTTFYGPSGISGQVMA